MGTKYYYYTLCITNSEEAKSPRYVSGGIKAKKKNLPVANIINDAADKYNTTIYNITIVFVTQISEEDYRRIRVLSDSRLEYTRL